nr:hypothetical protein GCM10020092_070970 [Actinoplanes digitatis]
MSNMLLMSGVVEALRKAGLEVRADSRHAGDVLLRRLAVPDSPLAVVRPRHVDEVAAALAVARETGVPLTSRGAGTSVVGNAVGRGIVLDFSRHLNRVLDVDPAARTAVVEPGTVHAVLQKAVMPHGVRFGPDPSTHPRCTIGGMIGNNACGSRSLAYGRTSDNVAGLELLTAAGDRLVTGYDDRGAAFARGADSLVADLRDVVGARLATARTEFDRFGRQVSGYAVQHLLPERFDLGRALVGSEGTLAVITQATVKLVVDAPVRVVVVLGFPDIIAAERGGTGRGRARAHLLRGARLAPGRRAARPPRPGRRPAAAPRRGLALRRAGRRGARRGGRAGPEAGGRRHRRGPRRRGPRHPGPAVAHPRGRRGPG